MNLCITFVCLLALFLAIHLSFESFAAEELNAGLNEDHVFFKFIAEQKQQILIYTLVAFSVSLVLGTALNLMVSHKVAGPIVRLRNFFAKPDNYKEIQYLNFRQGDFFIELPESSKSIKKCHPHWFRTCDTKRAWH